MSFEPEMSEWGNPIWFTILSVYESIVYGS